MPVDPERAEVAGVDPDHRGVEGEGAVELGRVVRLDQRVEGELAGGARQRGQLPVVEVAQQEEDCVRAGFLRGPEVVDRS